MSSRRSPAPPPPASTSSPPTTASHSSCLVKAISALVSCVLRSGPAGSRSRPTTTPSSRLSRQVLTGRRWHGCYTIRRSWQRTTSRVLGRRCSAPLPMCPTNRRPPGSRRSSMAKGQNDPASMSC